MQAAATLRTGRRRSRCGAASGRPISLSPPLAPEESRGTCGGSRRCGGLHASDGLAHHCFREYSSGRRDRRASLSPGAHLWSQPARCSSPHVAEDRSRRSIPLRYTSSACVHFPSIDRTGTARTSCLSADRDVPELQPQGAKSPSGTAWPDNSSSRAACSSVSCADDSIDSSTRRIAAKSATLPMFEVVAYCTAVVWSRPDAPLQNSHVSMPLKLASKNASSSSIARR